MGLVGTYVHRDILSSVRIGYQADFDIPALGFSFKTQSSVRAVLDEEELLQIDSPKCRSARGMPRSELHLDPCVINN